MVAEKKNEINEMVEVLMKMDSMSLMLVKNTVTVLAARDKLEEKREEQVQQ